MNDLEITRLCAEAVDLKPVIVAGGVYPSGLDQDQYDPLHDDAQAMALVKKFYVQVWPVFEHVHRGVSSFLKWTAYMPGVVAVDNADLNRAICECVAKMQAAKGKP